jgi:hypothetical protein
MILFHTTTATTIAFAAAAAAAVCVSQNFFHLQIIKFMFTTLLTFI